MSDECEKCGEHALEYKCSKHWSQTVEGKQAFLKALNERFRFIKDGHMIAKTENSYQPIILSEYYEKDQNVQ